MACSAYFIWCSIAVCISLLGLTPAPLPVLVGSIAGILVCNILIYVMIRSGFNKRFKDPSLTLLQMLIATFWVMVVLYYAGTARSAVLILYLVVFVFGLFKLHVREFLFLSGFAVINYTVVVYQIYRINPESINNLDVLNILILATVLPWFSLLGGYITRLRAKLSDSLSTIERMTNNMYDVIFVMDMNLHYTYVSPAIHMLRGYEPEEVMKQSPFDALTPSSLALTKQAMSEAAESGKVNQKGDLSWTLQLEINRKDGTTVWTETKFTFIRDKNQQPLQILGVMRDITKNRQLEEELRQGKEKYQNILENIQEGYFEVDLAGNLTFCNDSLCRVYGYSREELLGMNYRQYTEKKVAKKVFQAFNDVYKTRNALKELDWEIIGRDGSKRYVEGSASLLTDLSGKSTGFRGIIRDITERKRAEEQLLLIKRAVESASDAIGLSDALGRHFYQNKAFTDLLEYTTEELQTGGSANIFANETIAAEVITTIMKGDPWNGEVEMVSKSGRKFPILLRQDTIKDEKGNMIGFVGLHTDMTAHKQAEDEKRSLEERLIFAEKKEAIGQLAAGVAHVLNNVLGILRGYSELLLAEIPEGQRARGHVEKILQSTDRGTLIIRDLLTLASGGARPSEEVNLNSVVSDFLKTPAFEKLKDDHPGVIFGTVCDENLLNIKGSAVHLEKMILNLVSNAAEAITKTGKITMRTENRHLDQAVMSYHEIKEGDYAVLTISDTGTGIPAGHQEKIFEPFYSKKLKGINGTGLGLSIVWGTVKDHSGYVDLQSKVGEGTTFTLYFPITREATNR